MLRCIGISLCPIGRYGEIGLSFLQCCLHPVHHHLHSLHMARHTLAVQQNRRNNGMVTRIEKKWCVAYSHIDGVVHRKLHQCQMLTLASRSSLDIWSQEILHRLYHPLALSISLQMKCRAESEIRTEQVEQWLLELAGETRIPIRYDDLWETV